MKTEFLHKLNIAYKKLRLLENKRSRSLVDYLAANPGKTETEITIKFRLDQSAINKLLSSLKKVNIIYSERKGRNVFYFVDWVEYERIYKSLEKFSDAESN